MARDSTSETAFPRGQTIGVRRGRNADHGAVIPRSGRLLKVLAIFGRGPIWVTWRRGVGRRIPKVKQRAELDRAVGQGRKDAVRQAFREVVKSAVSAILYARMTDLLGASGCQSCMPSSRTGRKAADGPPVLPLVEATSRSVAPGPEASLGSDGGGRFVICGAMTTGRVNPSFMSAPLLSSLLGWKRNQETSRTIAIVAIAPADIAELGATVESQL